MKSTPFSIYSTWGLHDELGDSIHLDEPLALNALRGLDRWRDRGVRQDVFHLDAFWYDPAKGYRHFHPVKWPRGFAPLLEELRTRDMRPGLWYSTTGLTLEPEAWRESRCADGHHSLVDGPYADCLEADLQYAAGTWGVRLFKFDFANFAATPEHVRRAPDETRALAVEVFLGILGRLRSDFPDIHVISHVGFARHQHHQRAGWPDPPPADTALLGAIDGVFSGDPQPMDHPQTHLTRNIDLYQDRAVWNMVRAGFPLHRVEDHGVVIARTNTACYRGRAGFQRSHIAQLARGGRRDLFYGDPLLLTDADLDGMRQSRALFYDAWSRNLETRFVGAGEPGPGGWHGYLTGGAARGLLYVVNTGHAPRQVDVPLAGGRTLAATLYHDGHRPPVLQTGPDHVSIHLRPEQMALVGLGSYAGRPLPNIPDPDVPPPRTWELLPLDLHGDPDGGLRAETPAVDSSMLVVVRIRDDVDAKASPSPFPRVEGMQSTKAGEPRESRLHRDIGIGFILPDGSPLQPAERIPDVPVWSGMSWIAAVFPGHPGGRLRITSRLPPPVRIAAQVYRALSDGAPPR